jgi:hypothetical protein
MALLESNPVPAESYHRKGTVHSSLSVREARRVIRSHLELMPGAHREPWDEERQVIGASSWVPAFGHTHGGAEAFGGLRTVTTYRGGFCDAPTVDATSDGASTTGASWRGAYGQSARPCSFSWALLASSLFSPRGRLRLWRWVSDLSQWGSHSWCGRGYSAIGGSRWKLGCRRSGLRTSAWSSTAPRSENEPS